MDPFGELPMSDLNLFAHDGDMDGIHLLNRTIESFNGAAFRFELYYRHLEKRVEELNLELEKKNAELERNLKEKEEAKDYLRNILESLTAGVVVINLKGTVSTFNRAAEKITGLKAATVQGRSFKKSLYENLFSCLPVDPNFVTTVERTTNFETDIFRRHKDIVHARLSIFPVENPHGEKIGTAITIHDVTELKRLEEKANRTDKLAAMGEMAAQIAHEIRNPLGSIELFATTLKKDLEGMDDLRSLTEHISSGVRSMNSIISNLLLFVNPGQRPQLRPIDVACPLKEALFYSKYLIDSNPLTELDVQYCTSPKLVNADPELLKQVFMNLIQNAVQAMPKGGKLGITTRHVEEDRGKGTDFVEIEIRDTGVGIPENTKAKIFDPFFTTKTKGTGLGLAIVHNILKLHMADIDVETPKSGGTTCKVKLPLLENIDEDN